MNFIGNFFKLIEPDCLYFIGKLAFSLNECESDNIYVKETISTYFFKTPHIFGQENIRVRKFSI